VLGGRWTLRDIVDYELIATMALLETAADQRETLLRQIYEVNRETVGVASGAIRRRSSSQWSGKATSARPRVSWACCRWAASRSPAPRRPSRPMAAVRGGHVRRPDEQVFARYAKDLLEKQTYPEVRRSPGAPPEPPYDVTAWSLGMLLGVDTVFVVEAARRRRPPPQAHRGAARAGR